MAPPVFERIVERLMDCVGVRVELPVPCALTVSVQDARGEWLSEGEDEGDRNGRAVAESVGVLLGLAVTEPDGVGRGDNDSVSVTEIDDVPVAETESDLV